MRIIDWISDVCASDLTLETLWIVLPVSFTLTVVGLLESLLTAAIVDDLTDTPRNKNRESIGQGIANIASGFVGGKAVCAMLGQSVINVKSGDRKSVVGKEWVSTCRSRWPPYHDKKNRELNMHEHY